MEELVFRRIKELCRITTAVCSHCILVITVLVVSYILFCSLAVLDSRIGHTMDELSFYFRQ